MTLFEQQGAGDRRVNPAGHRQEDAHQRAARSCATMSGMSLRAMSTSTSVDVAPSEKRTLDTASVTVKPMARSTCLGPMAPLAHADPAEAHPPASSSSTSNASLSMPSKRMWQLPAIL